LYRDNKTNDLKSSNSNNSFVSASCNRTFLTLFFCHNKVHKCASCMMDIESAVTRTSYFIH